MALTGTSYEGLGHFGSTHWQVVGNAPSLLTSNFLSPLNIEPDSGTGMLVCQGVHRYPFLGCTPQFGPSWCAGQLCELSRPHQFESQHGEVLSLWSRVGGGFGTKSQFSLEASEQRLQMAMK
jgi:hypothetical protein